MKTFLMVFLALAMTGCALRAPKYAKPQAPAVLSDGYSVDDRAYLRQGIRHLYPSNQFHYRISERVLHFRYEFAASLVKCDAYQRHHHGEFELCADGRSGDACSGRLQCQCQAQSLWSLGRFDTGETAGQ